jgi:hypothetical protein
MFTFSLKKASTFAMINERTFSADFAELKLRFIRILKENYKNACNRDRVISLVEEIFKFDDQNISLFNVNSLKIICDFLGIDTKFILSSELEKKNHTKGEERIIEINKVLSANTYINAIGGVTLYSKDRFSKEKIELRFLEPYIFPYKQMTDNFIPNLSIIDVMMLVPFDIIKENLSHYILL